MNGTAHASRLIGNCAPDPATRPYPCSSADDDIHANEQVYEECAFADTTRFATTLDRIIISALETHQLDADIYRGIVYNPRTGLILKQAYHRGYCYITLCLEPAGRVVRLPVHRIVYYAAYKDTILGEGFDIHHIDGNRQNNSYKNLLKVPRKYHTVIGAFSNQYEAEEGYLRLLNARKPGSALVDAMTVKALRVCAAALPPRSGRKSIIFDYFAKKTSLSREYISNLSNPGRTGKSILPATPEEEAQIRKEYGWLIEAAREGRRVTMEENK